MKNNEIIRLEHKINDLEARGRFYEKIIVKLVCEEDTSLGEFVTILQLLEKYNKNNIHKISRKEHI